MNDLLARLMAIMQEAHGRDISVYDRAFLGKTVGRRMAESGTASAAQYLARLEGSAAEADLLYGSLNISFSEFFRNPLTFALLEQLVLPAILAGKNPSRLGEIRAWSAGCASGQEAYSLAILLEEICPAPGEKGGVPFRLFATDHCPHQLEAARRGVYDAASVRNVRQKHLLNYFIPVGDCYRVIAGLRARVDFSPHDLLDERLGSPSESIYGDFDLVFCGNLLFYYRADVRRRILDKLYRSLTPGGYLITGEAERELVLQHGCFSPVVLPSTVFRANPQRRA